MTTKSQRQKGRVDALSTLNVSIEALNLAKEISSITPAKAVFGSVSFLLTMIRDLTANKLDYIEIGLSCADVCQTLDRGLSGRSSDELGQSVLDAIKRLIATVADIQKKIVEQGKRNPASQLLHAKDDKDTIAAWRQDLARVLHVFNTELVISTHTMVADIHRNIRASQEDTYGKHHPTRASFHLGELPPPPPRACFGRDELITKLVDDVENLTPVALIGPGGIGKTSVALTVLHHSRIKERFGDDRRFIRCDRFPASCAHLLAQLSKVIGAGIENPEDLTSLRPFLSSKEILIILDNAESVLDPQGTDAQEIYAVVDELSQFRTLSLFITSRITTVPPHCKRPDIPTLSVEAACDIFYGIYGGNSRPGIIDDLLQRLDFHPLSISLLATTASRNMWDFDETANEWEAQRAQVLRTDYNQSLAATIELSLTSPTFRNLGSNARDLLGVVAFFPQGIDRNNLDWLFPTVSDRKNIFNKFCMLSLTHRSDNFITMLAPIRDYLRAQDPTSSSLLCATRDRYFSRLSANVHPGEPGFGEMRWIRSEDVNVEHLLDVFASIDKNSDNVWQACTNFTRHLYWHKQRHTVLTPRIEGLPDEHRSKPECLFELSRLFLSVGNPVEQKRLLVYALNLERERGNDRKVARILSYLSNVNRTLGFYGEGMQQSKEALEILERLNDTSGQANCLVDIAQLLHEDEQLDAAVEAACRGISLFPEKGQEHFVCQSHRALGNIYRSKGERDKAIRHFEVALGIASSFDWDVQLFWTHLSLSLMFFDEDRVDDAYAHLEKAKSQTGENTYNLGRALLLQARIRYRQRRLDDATSDALRALEIFEKLRAMEFSEDCRALLQEIEREVESRPTSGQSDSSCAYDTPPSTLTNTSASH